MFLKKNYVEKGITLFFVPMILKYISISELNFSKSYEDGLNKIKNLNRFNKFMTIFWLLGPFIYLIERDPADLWLTMIGIFFLVRCIRTYALS